MKRTQLKISVSIKEVTSLKISQPTKKTLSTFMVSLVKFIKHLKRKLTILLKLIKKVKREEPSQVILRGKHYSATKMRKGHYLNTTEKNPQ